MKETYEQWKKRMFGGRLTRSYDQWKATVTNVDSMDKLLLTVYAMIIANE